MVLPLRVSTGTLLSRVTQPRALRNIVVIVVILVTWDTSATTTGATIFVTCSVRRWIRCRLTVIQPFRKDIHRFVQMMNGHLVGGTTQTTRQGPNTGLVVHLAFNRIFIGAKGTFETFGQFDSLLCFNL
jgi:hypothetical protein